MPRYLLETGGVGDAQLDSAVRLAARRFPEIVIEQPPTRSAGPDDRACWVCRAPTAFHLERWADAAHLPLATVSHADAELLSTHKETPR